MVDSISVPPEKSRETGEQGRRPGRHPTLSGSYINVGSHHVNRITQAVYTLQISCLPHSILPLRKITADVGRIYDTVGFIRHYLMIWLLVYKDIAKTQEADILLHVVDARDELSRIGASRSLAKLMLMKYQIY